MRRGGPLAALALAAGLVLAAPATAQCRLALALGFDVSTSVSNTEYALIVDGTVSALRDPEVQAVVFAGPPVALAAFVWAGAGEQALAVGWHDIVEPADLERFASAIARFGRDAGDRGRAWGGRTGVGAAMREGQRLLAQRRHCDALTLDLAGDGINNDGPPPTYLPGITVNALAVGGDLPPDYEGVDAPSLSRWYRENVIQGPGAFVLEAFDYGDFARAIRQKLIRELSPPLLGALP